MSDDIASVGIKVGTDDVNKGINSLEALAAQGPKVEKAMQAVETASAKTGKSLKTLGEGGADTGLSKVTKTSTDAAAAVGKLADASSKTATTVKQVDKASADTAKAIAGVGSAVRSLVTSNEAVVASIRGMSTAQTAYTDKLAEEARQLRATVAERDKYIAQAQGMLSASKEIAAAIGGQVGQLKQVQTASAATSESMLSLVRTGVAGFLGGALATGAKAAAAAIYEASAAGERLRTMLNFATGGKSAEEIEYLRKVTNRLGLEFSSTATAYGQFQAAAKGTNLEGQKARDIFESIAKASAVMGLSTEQSSGALLALQQMISKGTVQAEELRGQLGERLPGAFQIAAKAMGVTTAELGKMLEQGLVVADDFLPKFARAINENIGGAAEGAADRLDAATNRFGNAWEKLKQTIGDAGVSKAIQSELKGLTNDVIVFGETMEKVQQKGGGLFAQLTAGAAAEAGRITFSILNAGVNDFNRLVNLATGSVFKLNENVAYLPDILKTNAQQAAALTQDLARAEAEFAALQARGAATSQNIYLRSEYGYLAQYIAKLKEAQAEKAKLEAGPAYNAARDSQSASAAEAARLDSVRAAMQKVQQSLSGVKDSFYRDLNALKAGYDEGLIKLGDYQEAVKKLIDESGGGKVAAAGIKATNKELAEQKKLTLELAGLTGDFLEEWNRLPKIYKDVDKLAEAQARLLEKQPAIKAAKQEEIALNRALYAQQLQTSEETAAAYVAESKAREQGRLAVYEYGRAIDEQNALTELELSLAGRTQKARDLAIAQYRIELELKKQIQAIDKNAGFDEAQRIEERTKAREAAARAMAGAERRVYVDEWKRTTDEIERSLTDALLRGFESGKGFAENLRDTIVNLFKTMVLKPVIQAVVQPVAGSLTNAVSGLFGGSAGGGFNFSNFSSLLGAGKTAWGAFGGAAGSVGAAGSLGSLSADAGALQLITGSSGAAGAGSLGSLSSFGPWAALIAAGMGQAGKAYSQGFNQNNLPLAAQVLFPQHRLDTNLLSGIVGDKWANIISGASLTSKLFQWGGGTPHRGAMYLSDGTTGYVPPESYVGDMAWGDSVYKNHSQEVEDALKTLTGGAAQLLNTVSGLFGGSKNYSVGGYYSADNDDPSQGNTRIFKGGSAVTSTSSRYASDPNEGYAQFTTELAGQVRQALLQADIPEWAKSQFKALADTANFENLTAVVAQVAALQQALGQLGDVMPQLSGLTGEAVDGLLKAMGGIDNLTAAAGSYYENFYSDAEKTATATRQLSEQLQAFGISVPATREAYRALVEAQNLNTESGRAAYAELLRLSPAFAALVPATEALGEAADGSAAAMEQAAAKMAEAGRKVLADLAQQQGGLQVDLLRAQGDAAGAAALERQNALARLVEGLSSQDAAAATAAYDFNAALRDQIAALNEATSTAQRAAEAEAQRAASVASERYGLEGQLLQLMGSTAELRARELQALDPSNRAIQEHIYALLDEQAAQQEAARAAQEAAQAAEAAAQAEAQRVAAIEQQRGSLQDQIDQLLGNTAALRARELEALDPSVRALQQRIYDLQDEQAAQQAVAQAAQAAAAALEQQAEAERQRVAAIAGERSGLEDQLLRQLGDTAAIRQRELAALDPSNRDLLARIYALQDEQEAAASAAQAARDLEAAQRAAADAEAQRIQAISSERFNLEGELLRLQGNTAALRERELEALDPSNRALLEQIYAIEDQQAANEAAAQAAEEAARAADQLRQSWQSVTDTIFDEVNRIRGLIANGSDQSLAGAQARFAVTAAQAKAGDQEAARLLPTLSQAMLTIAEAQATSLLELQRIRAQAADSLIGVGDSIAGRFGLTLPKLDTGTNYVPQDMVALIHEGEAVVPRAYNHAASGSTSTAELAKQVRQWREKSEKQSDQIIAINNRMAQILERWEFDGLPEERTT